MSYKYNSVLIIDDSEFDNFITEQVINRAKFSKTVHVQNSVHLAIDFLTNEYNRKSVDFPEVIFIDINMPVTNGFDFISSLKNDPPKWFIDRAPKLAILTTSIYQADEIKAREIFEDISFVVKPLGIDALTLF